ncbi:MAG: hypothetical protein K2L75_03160, partial [Muribaculaceae bacterium]|nr:hypothetical protein [Muribaculaceae bacterium]
SMKRRAGVGLWPGRGGEATSLSQIYEEYSMKRRAGVGLWPGRGGEATSLSQIYGEIPELCVNLHLLFIVPPFGA